MQALTDDQHIAAVEAKVDKLEKKVDAGFKDVTEEFRDVRTEFRAVRAEIGGLNRTILSMWLTMIVGFAGILLQNHL
jgi:hypothetical protein